MNLNSGRKQECSFVVVVLEGGTEGQLLKLPFDFQVLVIITRT